VTDVWNDLEPPVSKRHPAIRDARRALEGQGALLAAMSGSGSAVFGVFDSSRAVSRAAGRLRRYDGRVLVARAIGGAAYRTRSAPRIVGRLPRSVRIG
jgi:4-diphosphocytidyl-2-C-methyl-D-erythritol kinase